MTGQLFLLRLRQIGSRIELFCENLVISCKEISFQQTNSSWDFHVTRIQSMLAKLNTLSLLGIEALPVEVDVSGTPMPKTMLVGLPEAAVKESIHLMSLWPE